MWRKGNIFALLVGMQIGAVTVESSMKIPQKIKNETAFWSSDPASGIISEGTQEAIQKNISIPVFIAALFTITKIWKQPKCPSVDEWIKQLWNIYTMDYSSAIKKKKNSPFETVWMDLENIMLSEISQAVRDKYHMISPMSGT